MPPITEKLTLAQETAAYRQRHNLTMHELADLLGCNRKTISNIENGAASPAYDEKLWALIRKDAPASKQEAEEEPELEPEEVEQVQDIPEAVSAWLKKAYSDRPGPPVIIYNAVLDNTRDKPSFRGNPDVASMQEFRIAPYQRGLLGRKVMEGYVKYYAEGDTMPELTLGMRGHKYQYDEKTKTLTLLNPVFLIDGFQRVGGALYASESGEHPYLSARVYLDTDVAWEREKFRKLDTLQVKISPNIAIRNRQDDVPFIKMLFELSFDPGFVLCRRVQWGQNAKRDELSSAYGQLRVLSRLFSRLDPGLKKTGHFEMADRLQKAMQKMGRRMMRQNIINFWQIVDEALGIRNITNKDGSLQVGQSFNSALARVYAAHEEFWVDNELIVPWEFRKKLAIFPLKTNEDIRALAQASIDGAANDRLALYLVDCFNRRRPKSKRIKPFAAAPAIFHTFHIAGGTM